MIRSALALVGLALLVPAAASGAPDGQLFVDRSAAYLQQAQNSDGGFGGSVGKPSDPVFTSWAAMAMAAAGVNPADLRRPGGNDALSYLKKNVDKLSVTTDFERTLLVAVSAGDGGRDFGGRDLVETILERQKADGSFTYTAAGKNGTINSTAFAVLALAGTNDAAHKGSIARAASWLREKQNSSGGYGWTPGAPSDPDMTAAVVQALRAAGLKQTDTEQRAVDYLRGAQNEDGGFALTSGEESNAPSTAWVLQALWAAGIDPETWSKPKGSPLDFVASMQQPDGSVRQSKNSDPNRTWVTAYALPAMAGRSLPISFVPFSDSSTPLPEGGSGSPEFGEAGKQESVGVTGGGRGAGAQAFTRPRPGGRGNPNRRPGRERTNTDPEKTPPRSASNTSASREDQSLGEVARSGSPTPAVPVRDGGQIVTGLPLSATGTGAGPAASGLRTAVKGNSGGSATWLLLFGVGLALGGGLIAEFRSIRWVR